MSEIFHKSCYTSRSPGYKYRTLSTNTGERKRRDSLQDNIFDRKFRELQREITSRVDNQVKLTQFSRASIMDKFAKIDAKINSLLELQNTISTLRGDLGCASSSLGQLVNKVDSMEVAMAKDEGSSLNSKKSSFRVEPIFEERKIMQSNITVFK